MTRLILASQSRSRRRLLINAGIEFTAMPSPFDEDSAKEDALARGMDAADLAHLLAHGKAGAVARDYPDAIVIGADQILVCNGKIYNKPADMAAARTHLQQLRGQRHCLLTAYVLMRGDTVLARHLDRPELSMRDFSDDFLDVYLELAGENILSSVGAYLLEGLGIQLFDHIAGDYHSILGLPLWPLLSDLREQGVISS